MTIKNLIFYIIAFLWLITNIILYFIYDNMGPALSNMIFSAILVILIFIKLNNKRFANWLETNIKQ